MDQLMDFKTQNEYLQEAKFAELIYGLQSARYNLDNTVYYGSNVGGGDRKKLTPKQKANKAAKNKAAKKARKKNRR